MVPEDLLRGVVKSCLLPYGLLARERRTGVTILAYHRVGGHGRRQLDMPVDIFAWQMQYLRRHHTVVSLDELVARIRNGQTGHDTVAITFDDGSAEIQEHALPVLKDLGLPATVYLATGPIETGQPLPFEAFLSPGDRGRPLSWDQVERLRASGLITLGAHTHAHPDLSALSSSQIEDELECANAVIRRRTGVTPAHFAYPWGRGLANGRAVVGRMYVTAAIAGTRKNAYADIDLHALRRVPLQRSDGRMFFRLKLGSYLIGEEGVRALMDGRRPGLRRPAVPRSLS